jgi:hypothetical protein
MAQPTSTQTPLSIIPVVPSSRPGKVPPLENGDHLDQRTFHERYLAMPDDFRAELVEGMVLVSSPVKLPHGTYHTALMGWMFLYKASTPGTGAADNATAILGDESEPQPDGSLFILPECGGQCRIVDGYLTGAPELLGEVASASEATDLHGKYRDYERAGTLEYLVILVREQAVRWFVRQGGRFEPLMPDDAGVFRSRVFPGLWLDSGALFRDDDASLIATLQQGLQSAEHTAFVSRLQAQRTR